MYIKYIENFFARDMFNVYVQGIIELDAKTSSDSHNTAS